MKELAGRVAALDPDAGAALQVIAYFDRLTEGRVGLEALVRGAAVLSGCPARLVDERRGIRVRVRVQPDGRRDDSAGPVDPAWPWVPLDSAGPAVSGTVPDAPVVTSTVPGTFAATASAPGAPVVTDTPTGAAALLEPPAALWLERPGAPDGVHAMVLERAARAVRDVMGRYARVGAPCRARARSRAGRGGAGRVRSAGRPDARRSSTGPEAREVGASGGLHGGGAEIVLAGQRLPGTRRAGVGPAVEVAELPQSWAAARTALRLTAEGTAQDPGPGTVHAEELGALVLLATAVGPDTPPFPDVLAVERAVAEAPWAAATLRAVASSSSLRAAATELTVHHSTLQERLAQTEHILGWDVHSPQGRLRLQLALAIRKLQSNPVMDAGSGQAATPA